MIQSESPSKSWVSHSEPPRLHSFWETYRIYQMDKGKHNLISVVHVAICQRAQVWSLQLFWQTGIKYLPGGQGLHRRTPALIMSPACLHTCVILLKRQSEVLHDATRTCLKRWMGTDGLQCRLQQLCNAGRQTRLLCPGCTPQWA